MVLDISNYVYPAIVLVEAITLLLITKNMSSGYKLIFGILGIYWILSYVLRPVFYLYSQSHNISSALFDARIAGATDYFPKIMNLIIVGNAIFCVVIYFEKRRVMRNIKRLRIVKKEDPEETFRIIGVGFFIGLLSLIVEITKFKNPFSKSLLPLCLISFCAYLWKRRQLDRNPRIDYSIIALGTFTSIAISLRDNNSKGVILTPVLLLTFRYIERNYQRKKFFYGASFGVLVLCTLPAFNFLQKRKLGETSIQLANQFSENFPWYMSPFLTILQRFDQFSRVVDSYFASDSPLGGYSEWINLFALNLQWNPTSGREASSFGQMWNQLVTNQSISGARFSKVSLAQGPIAEGFVWDGNISMILECFVMALVFIGVCRAMDGKILSVMFGLGVIGNGRLFENGTIGIAATVSSTLKFVLFMFVISKIFPATVHQQHSLLDSTPTPRSSK